MIRRPPRSTQSRSSAASDVYKRQVVALVIRDAAKHRVVRPPGMPDEVEEREAHGDPDPGQDAEDDDAEEADDRQSELGPAEAEEPTRASEVEQAQGGGDDDRGQG